jgi:hypothetical protein
MTSIRVMIVERVECGTRVATIAAAQPCRPSPSAGHSRKR